MNMLCKTAFCFLAVFLTAVMQTVSAAGFADSAAIGLPYGEAVEKMTDLGVLNGFPDGSFQPRGTLTREQGAKIVTYMLLGEEVNGLTCSRAPFTDVAVDRWSAPCIAWCADRAILLGYGDGMFGPEDRLTGDQFAKMLLCALRLAREGNYAGLGDAWFTAVREDARGLLLYEGDPGMASSLPVTREQAALLAWNALKAADSAKAPGAPAVPVTPADPGEREPVSSEPLPSGNPGADDDNDTEMPVIVIPPHRDNPVPADPDPIPVDPIPVEPAPVEPTPSEPEPGEEGSGGKINDNGDIILPEVP